MTREKFIKELNFNCKVDGKEVWLNIMPCLEKLLDEHEAESKKQNEAYATALIKANELFVLVGELTEKITAKDEEIEKLKAIVEEAIRKPMGVEPHSWSDYKMLKDRQC